jgi:hypothetical protein
MDRELINQAKEPVQGFLRVLFGPAFSHLGETLGDSARMWRFRRVVKHVGRAQKMLKDSGTNPKSVDLKFLLPWMENASLEQEDDDLAERWAALLANAAGQDPSSVASHLFPKILANLSAKEARLLDAMYQKGLHSMIYGIEKDATSISRDTLIDRDQLASLRSGFRWRSNEERDFALDNLVNQGLLRIHQIIDPKSYPALAGKLFAEGRLSSPKPLPADVIVRMRLQYQVTVVGVQFVRACQPPKVQRGH